VADLVEALDAHLASRAVSDEQRPDRLHAAIGGLRHARRAARQRRSSGLHRIDGVGLAVAATGLPVRAIDLHHRHPNTAQEAGQAGPVGAGALHPDPLQRAKTDQPGVQVGEPGGGRRERPEAEQTAVDVQRGSDVHIQMGVDSAGDRARLYDGHRHPFSVQLGQGVARTSREGDRDDRLRLTDRSITLRNGACPYPPTGRPTRIVSMPDKSHRTVGAADRSPPPSQAGGPQQSTPPSSLGIRSRSRMVLGRPGGDRGVSWRRAPGRRPRRQPRRRHSGVGGRRSRGGAAYPPPSLRGPRAAAPPRLGARLLEAWPQWRRRRRRLNMPPPTPAADRSGE
jgi:hypothetical protein